MNRSGEVNPLGAARAAWGALGESTAIEIRQVEIVEVELTLRVPVHTARSVHRRRPVVLVHLVGDADGRPLDGWGECAALSEPTYDREGVAEASEIIAGRLVPALSELCRSTGRLPPIEGLHVLRRVAPDAPLSCAAVEMAVADLHLRAEGRSFAAVLGAGRTPAPVGAVVGTTGNPDALVEQVDALVRQGYLRVKLKVGPGADVGPVRAVRDAFADLRIQVDGNESYTEETAGGIVGLDELGVDCIEQPFARDDLGAHARLAQRIRTPICLDESLSSPEAVARALRAGACSVVCLKPARLGGITPALDVARRCVDAGIPLWIGGMFETTYARGVNAALGGLVAPGWPGDLSPPRSYLSDDPWAETGGASWCHDESGALCVVAGRMPGMGPLPAHPDLGAVSRSTRVDWSGTGG